MLLTLSTLGPFTDSTLIGTVVEQLLASITVALYIPEYKLSAIWVDCIKVSSHIYVYAPVPPDALMVAVPSALPHLAGWAVAIAESICG